MPKPTVLSKRFKLEQQVPRSAPAPVATSLHAGTRPGLRYIEFWLPILVIISAVWVGHADSRYVGFSNQEWIDSVDLVQAVGGSNIFRRIVFPAMAAVGVLLLWRSKSRPIRLNVTIAMSAIVALSFVGASLLWSTEPSLTFRRATIVFLIAVAALGIGRTWTALDLCHAALLMSLFFVCASILVELRSGTFLRGATYRFSGYFHPNQQAINTSILALSAFCCFKQHHLYRYLALGAAGIFLTKLTGSRGCSVALLCTMILACWLMMSRTQRVAAVIGMGVSVSIVMILLSIQSKSGITLEDLAWMGRTREGSSSSVLSGRVEIWSVCIRDILARPLTGYGYGAFWTPERVLEYSVIHNWAFNHAHSAYLESSLNIGIPGSVALFACATAGLTTCLRLLKRTPDWGITFLFLLISFGAISGLVDSMSFKIGFATIVLAIGVMILAVNSPLNGSPDRPTGCLP